MNFYRGKETISFFSFTNSTNNIYVVLQDKIILSRLPRANPIFKIMSWQTKLEFSYIPFF